jgi:hypothetical protein
MGIGLIWVIRDSAVIFYACGEDFVNYLKEYWFLSHVFVHLDQLKFHFRALVNSNLGLHKRGEGRHI